MASTLTASPHAATRSSSPHVLQLFQRIRSCPLFSTLRPPACRVSLAFGAVTSYWMLQTFCAILHCSPCLGGLLMSFSRQFAQKTRSAVFSLMQGLLCQTEHRYVRPQVS